MPLPLRNTFETGLADTTAITAANSDDGSAGDAFNTVDTGFTFSTTHAANGTLAAKLTQAGVAATKLLVWTGITATDIMYGRVYWYLTANPGSGFNAITFLFSGGVAAAININPTGVVQLSAGTPSFGDLGSTTNSLLLNAWNRFEWKYDAGNGSTTGQFTVRLYAGNSTSLIEEKLSTLGNLNSQVITLRHGINATNANYIYWLDDIAANLTGFPGPSVTPAASDDPPMHRLGRGAGW